MEEVIGSIPIWSTLIQNTVTDRIFSHKKAKTTLSYAVSSKSRLLSEHSNFTPLRSQLSCSYPLICGFIAPVAQWIELSRPKREIWVRFLVGAHKHRSRLFPINTLMASLRIVKINELLRQQLAEIMERDLSLKPGVFITIAKIDTSKDLRYTRMFISVFPEQETHYVSETLKKELAEAKAKLAAIQAATGGATT